MPDYKGACKKTEKEWIKRWEQNLQSTASVEKRVSGLGMADRGRFYKEFK